MAEARTAGAEEMQDGVREAIAALGMPDLGTTGEVRWDSPPVWYLWLPGRAVDVAGASLGGWRDIVAVLGDGNDGRNYADFPGWGSAAHEGPVPPLRGEEVRPVNAAFPPCPGELWRRSYPRTPAGLADLAADAAAARAWKETVAR